MPLRFAVPFPLLVNVSAEGRVPVSLSVGAGTPDATKVYDTDVPTTNGEGLLVTGMVGAVELCVCDAADWLPPPQPTRLSPNIANRMRPERNRPTTGVWHGPDGVAFRRSTIVRLREINERLKIQLKVQAECDPTPTK
jgi:hypothetical protein